MAVTACSFPPADFTAVIDRPDASYTVRVYDSTDLVVAANAADIGHPGPAGDAEAHPDARTIDVHWLGGECLRTPVIHVDGNESDLQITVEPDATAGIPLPVACSAVGVLLDITLQLSVPVEQSALTFATK